MGHPSFIAGSLPGNLRRNGESERELLIEVSSALQSGERQKIEIGERKEIEIGDARRCLASSEIGATLLSPRLERNWRDAAVASPRAKLARRCCRLASSEIGATLLSPRLERNWRDANGHQDTLVAQAEVGRLQVQLERESVRAPITGTELYLDINAGEHVMSGSLHRMVTLGLLTPLNVRVQMDEMDAWRFRPESKAIAMPRGGAKGEFPLRFLRLVLLITPKRLLNGDSAESVDVCVMEVEYELDNPGTMSEVERFAVRWRWMSRVVFDSTLSARVVHVANRRGEE